MPASHMRWCPSCESERDLGEVFCEGCLEKGFEPWPISQEPIRPSGWRPATAPSAPPPEPAQSVCPNGHPITAGDFICPECHIDIPAQGDTIEPGGFGEPDRPPYEPPSEIETPDTIDGWRLDRRLSTPGRVRERFVATRRDDDRSAVLTLYAHGHEPDPSVYALLQRLPRDHVPELLATGRWNDRVYDVCEHIEGGPLADRSYSGADLASVRRLALEIGSALRTFAEFGLRHRDLRPGNIHVRTSEPLDLVITGFGSARLSEFDLDIVAPLETTPYTAPEAVVGAVAPASDWWSLGMILLEQVTEGRCFDGINPRVFLVHALASGVAVPSDLPPELQTVLRGLLVRDRTKRWGWPQLNAWLDGEAVEVPADAAVSAETGAGRAIRLGNKAYTSPTRFALEAADAPNWDKARDLLLRGEIATWATEIGLPDSAVAMLRQITRHDGLHDDFRLSIALKLLNENMPLACRGDIINPAWLLEHSDLGYALIAGPAPDILAGMGAEPWLSRLKMRAGAVREKARLLEINLEEATLRAYLLATSRVRLAAEWDTRRRLFPDTEHAGIASLMERRQSAEEDFIILLAADLGYFRSRDEVIGEAEQLAQRAGIALFDRAAASRHLDLSRRDLIAEVRRRTGDLARCGIARADEWVEQLRLERRLPIGRALVLLAVPAEQWCEPPKHEYYQRILDYFEKKVTISLTRGPLVRMTIGKTTPRIDVCELGSTRRRPDDMVAHVLRRSDQSFEIDPAVFATPESSPESRLRHLVQGAALYKRDTGIDGLYLGFPFLIARDGRVAVKPRIAPILLWPIRVDAAVGVRGNVTVAFDRDREDVRINPALEGIVGVDEIGRWRDVIEELLGRSALSPGDVMDAFSALAACAGQELARLPGRDVQVPPGARRAVPSAVIFHLSYIGQAIVDDLRRLKARAPDSTALAALLRIASLEADGPAPPPPREIDRFFSAASDPSQESAVFAARNAPGLLLEGPPGTGKSQTIVNIIADAIGRKRSVLVVCQKHAAIDVVRKRLEKEGLQDRCIMVTDINKDRQHVLQMIRDQAFNLRRNGLADAGVRRKRQQLAHLIEELEGQLDRRHKAVHDADDETGLSYRALLGELIELEADGPAPFDVPRLRGLLETLPSAQRAAIEEACASLARYWLPARFEGNPLHSLKAFHSDPATLRAFLTDFERFAAAEAQRERLISQGAAAFEVTDAESTRVWVSEASKRSAQLSAEQRGNIALWISLFALDASARTGKAEGGKRQLEELDELLALLETSGPSLPSSEMANILLTLDDDTLRALSRACDRASAPTSLIGLLNPLRYFALRQLRRFLRERAPGIAGDVPALIGAVRFERELRILKQRLAVVLVQLKIDNLTLTSLPWVGVTRLATHLRQSLGDVETMVRLLERGPRIDLALRHAEAGTLSAFLDDVAAAVRRCDTRMASAAALAALGSWFEDPWLSACRSAIATGQSNMAPLETIAGALPTLEAFQQFRRRAMGLDETTLKVFAHLRDAEAQLSALPTHELSAMLRRIIAREARLAMKASLEAREPALLLDQTEMEVKTRTLGDADVEMRRLNSRLLADGIDSSQVQGTQQAWTSITRLRAARGVPRSSIRDLIENGRDLGLFELRPVWLANPDVASRILPLTPGLFDVVVYDEASQMPIEYALPSLFRAGLAVVSGDEKQMPPTSFFAGRIEDDEDTEIDDSEQEGLSDSAREALEETWNRREIKDCPDLLNLARVSLPSRGLEVHYRSAYRELIAFSNAAFYGNRLNVPVQHPEAVVRRERPIEVIQVDGVYTQQTNPAEADRIVDLLEGYWSQPPERRPSIGVVTFNRKQADLIEDRLETRAEQNATFRQAYIAEQQRTQDHEDIGFFVKNVENVQGDERDLIIFSTTFGRNERGVFRRNFGVLGQQGGRRRLNVAVTRAKQKIIVATSIPIGEVSDMLATHRPPMTERDYLQGYLEFGRAITAQDLDAGRALCRRMVTEGTRTERRGHDVTDGFVRSVERFVGGLGYEATLGGERDAFAVDLAIVDPRTGLFGIGIECDAPRDDILARARARELWRPKILAGTVRQLHRVSCVDWYERRTYEQERLRLAIEAALSTSSGRAA